MQHFGVKLHISSEIAGVMLHYTMSLLALLLFGAIVGWITTMFVDTSRRNGLFGNIILGILGSMVGDWIMNFFGKAGVTGFNLYSIFVGVIGAAALITLFRIINGR